MTEILAVLSNRVVDVAGILLIFILLLATSRLYTKRQYDEIVSIYKDVADRALSANEKMLNNDDVTHALLTSLQKNADER